MTDGQGTVLVGGGHLSLGHEPMAGYPAQGGHDRRREGLPAGLGGSLLGKVGYFPHETLALAVKVVGGQGSRRAKPEEEQ